MVEAFGYLSMVVVLVSMLMKDIKTLRIVNSIACGMFVIYGFMLGSYPIVIMNVLVIAINIYKLVDWKGGGGRCTGPR